MRKSRNSAKLFAILVLATALTACGDLANSITGEVQQSVIGEGSGSGKLVSVEKRSYGQNEIEELHVNTQAMEIQIEKSSGDRAEVELLADDNLRDRFEFEAKVKSGVLDLKIEEKSGLSFKEQKGERKLKISLPDKVYRELEVQNAFGAVEASDVKTETANIRIDAGNIRLRGVSGELNLKASAGEIVVEGISLDRDLNARTEVGRIAIHLSESPKAVNFRLDSEVGEVKVDLEQVEYSKQTTNKKFGTIGAGGPNIDAYTAVGEIVVDAN